MEKASSNALSCALAGGADTIVARATPPGRGALAIVRVSGSLVSAVALRLCSWQEPPAPWRARLVELRGPDGEVVDTAVAMVYRAPTSFTGEDMLELSVHGSPYVVEQVIEACVAAGCRRAGPGEFSRRAVANGKMDLLQAEAVRDLIAADTAWQARNARQQLAGLLSRRMAEIHRRLVEARALLEATLDFADGEVDAAAATAAAGAAVTACLVELRSVLASSDAGSLIRDGVRVVIAGRPNSGKSTLFNRLLGAERAIVSDRPGTTRDVVEAEMEVAGLRVVVADTAGLRDPAEEVEREGVRRAHAAVAGAGVVILLSAADSHLAPPRVAPELTVVRVLSKADLDPARRQPGWLRVSAASGEGMDSLRDALAREVAGGVEGLGDEVAIAARHRSALERALAALEGIPLATPELAAEHLRWAAAAVAEMVGAIDDEEVLDAVFDTFCIGK